MITAPKKETIMKRRILSTAVMGIATAAVLSGCVTLTTADPSSQKEQPTASSSSPRQKPTAGPSDGGSADASDGGGEASDGGGEKSAEAEHIDTHGKPTYLNAIQAFSPELDTWVIDGKTLTYRKTNCLGKTKAEATGTLGEVGDNGATPVTWKSTKKSKDDEEKGNPFMQDGGEYSGMTTQLQITDDVISEKDMPEIDQASSKIDDEKAAFDGMCTEAGQAVAEFVFPG